jgi:gamma-glutamyl:cysteine ligase YbdK (ATP-grasp superfamily)
MSDNPVGRLIESKEIDFDEFERRVREEGDAVIEELEEGTFDNPQTTVGLEYEFYAVDEDDGTIRRVHRSLLQFLGFEKELGLHNTELTTGVQPCNGAGLDAMAKEVEAKLVAADEWAAGRGVRLVSDGMWTIGPGDHPTPAYLMEATHEEGLTLAINVSNAVRYHGFASSERRIGGRIDVPGVTLEADNPGPVSLTTSIQPHFQLERAADLPRHFAYALRLAGPLLALGVNSPLFPPELYDELDRRTVLEDGWAEHRIPVYEDMMNPADGPEKVRFPADIDRPRDAVDRIVEDRVLVPAAIAAGERFDDAFVHFRHKHGSFWRWVRPVFDGGSRAAANARIEFRPLPGQPTLRDTMAFLATFAGAMTAFPASDHPVADLSWERARENFYAAARAGMDADLTWITADGQRTSALDRCLDDLLDTALEGLERCGLPRSRAADWVEPLRDRARRRRTPAAWKRSQVATRLDEGLSLPDAIHGAQREYLARQRETLVDGCFSDWPTAGRATEP